MRAVSFWASVALASSFVVSAQEISSTSLCGASVGLTCQGSTFGNCCSQYGYCGSTDAYCGGGCQAGFGSCNNLASTLSTDARCGYEHGSTSGATCLGSGFGDCCSQHSYCGASADYCGTGCQSGFGSCNPVSSSVSSQGQPTSSSTATRKTSSSTTATRKTSSSSITTRKTSSTRSTSSTSSSRSSQASSVSSSSSSHSSTHSLVTSTSASSTAQSTSSLASSASPSSSTPTPSASSMLVSTNSQCGPNAGGFLNGARTCLGSIYGDCCSEVNLCGSSSLLCGPGCQPEYGNCGVSSSSSSSSSPSVQSTTSSSSSSSSTSAASSSTPSASSSCLPLGHNCATSSDCCGGACVPGGAAVGFGYICAQNTATSSSTATSSASSAMSSSSSTAPLSTSAAPSATPSVDTCGPILGYAFWLTPTGTTETILEGAYTSQECCQACQSLKGCAAWQQVSESTTCNVYTQFFASSNAAQCIGGIQNVGYFAGSSASWGPGPCGTPVQQGG